MIYLSPCFIVVFVLSSPKIPTRNSQRFARSPFPHMQLLSEWCVCAQLLSVPRQMLQMQRLRLSEARNEEHLEQHRYLTIPASLPSSQCPLPLCPAAGSGQRNPSHWLALSGVSETEIKFILGLQLSLWVTGKRFAQGLHTWYSKTIYSVFVIKQKIIAHGNENLRKSWLVWCAFGENIYTWVSEIKCIYSIALQIFK